MSASVVYPVQILREHITGLEAAIAVCLADPDGKPVHKLRTETRRVEALLTMLGLIPGVPDHRKEAAKMLRALRKLRRAAGAVRDLDVHRKMLEALASKEEAVAAQDGASGPPDGERDVLLSAKEKARTKKGRAAQAVPQVEATQTTAALLSASAAELREEMGRARDKAARILQDVLNERQLKTTKASGALLATLHAGNDLALPGAEVLRDAEAILTRNGPQGKRPIEDLGKHELHTIRKAAKQARYLAESLPEDAALAAAARHFESLQEAGGQWHDAMQLARAARQHFGKTHELTGTYRQDRDRKLERYRAALASAMRVEQGPKRDAETQRETTDRKGRASSRKSSAAAA